MEKILFFVFATLAVLSAFNIILQRNPLYSAVSLIGTLASVSALFVMLHAPFIGALQIIVYAGAIMVLFLFVIMLMNLDVENEPQKNKWMKLAGVVSGGCLLLVIVAALKNAEVRGQAAIGQGDIGLIEHLGKALFTDYVIPFEISSILFLSAMVGAVVVGKKGD
jgi:NADH-quinone oxidoreductase subunit J